MAKFALPILAAVQPRPVLDGDLVISNQCRQPRMDTLFYFVIWTDRLLISTDPKPDQFTEQVFGGEYEESNLGNFIPYENML